MYITSLSPKHLLRGVISIVIILGLLGFPADGKAAYSAALSSPIPPNASSIFVWDVDGIKDGPGTEIGAIYLSGCWTTDDVLSIEAVDNSGNLLPATWKTTGPYSDQIEVKLIKDKKLPIQVTVTFVTQYLSSDTGTMLIIKTGGRSNQTINVGGPTCQPPPVETGLSIHTGSSEIIVTQGNYQSEITLIDLTKSEGDMVNVVVDTTITPDNGGIGIYNDYPESGYFASSTTTFVLNQSFTGYIPGTYLVTNTTSIVGTTITASETISIIVEIPGGNPIIGKASCYPDGVHPNEPTQVTFTATPAKYSSPPEYLILRRIDGVTNPIIGELRDEGTSGDLLAGDSVYSGTFEVNEANEGVVNFQASGYFLDIGERQSMLGSLFVTELPVYFQSSDTTKVVSDPISHKTFFSNEVVAEFSEETLTGRRIEIASAVNGVIVGTYPRLGVHQILLSSDSLSGVYEAIETLLTYPEVTEARPNYYSSGTDEFTPNDPRYDDQYGPVNIRADEAWVMARGGPLIAIVDTGVDYNHEDLAGKVILGPDFVSGGDDNDPMDEHPLSHGTHVAGIAAAYGDNGKGIAGIAMDSQIIAIRALGGSCDNIGKGIEEAADRGAKIINVSGGCNEDITSIREAVEHAVSVGRLIVSTPGNIGSSVSVDGQLRYPGAYEDVMAVGALTESNLLWDDSNQADYVDIVAPGDSILSTIINNQYGVLSGTSMAAPHVTGAAAVVWGRYPSWSADQVRQRLERTAFRIADPEDPFETLSGTGAGKVDLFSAVFNSSFEDGLSGWTVSGTASSTPALGMFFPTHLSRMGMVSSGPDILQIVSYLEQSFPILPGVSSSFPIKMTYNFISEEWPEWVGLGFNDNLRIMLINPNGLITTIAYEDIDTSTYSLFTGLDLPGGDNTIGETGRKDLSATVDLIASGTYTLRIVVRDEGDGIYDSVVLVDNIKFK